MTPSLLTKSKRWLAASIAMVLMFAVSIPALGIPEEVAADLRTKFSWVVLAFIGGQTVTDAVTKGKTSGNYRPTQQPDGSHE
jgi:hypothetical protein